MVNLVGTAVTVTPSGGQSDSAAEARKRQRQTPVSDAFLPQDAAEQAAGRPGTSLLQKAREAGQSVMQLLRRRTDRGEAADPGIEIPPHLERRRAWREAFGVNTYHTQQLAQAEEPALTGEAQSSAHSAYRSAARRGRLDLDLAQQVSVTV